MYKSSLVPSHTPSFPSLAVRLYRTALPYCKRWKAGRGSGYKAGRGSGYEASIRSLSCLIQVRHPAINRLFAGPFLFLFIAGHNMLATILFFFFSQIVDLEFAGVGLRAYDIGLMLETLIFQLICHSRCGNEDTVRCLHQVLHRGLQAYEAEIGAERFTNPSFVSQVCGLIGCEELWK